MIRMLEVKSYTGFILDNPCWSLISNMLIISFHFMICSKSGEEIEVTSVRVYKKNPILLDMLKYQMGDRLKITGIICIDENNDDYKDDDSDIFLMII